MDNLRSHLGSSLDDFLRETGTYEESTATAKKKVAVWEADCSQEQRGDLMSRVLPCDSTTKNP